MMFTPGDKLEFGHYTILRELGSGGMGVVYHCRDEFLQRELAVKMLLPELMADNDTVEVFRQEARLAAQLEHPGIVTIYNIGMENREGKIHHYMAMEYLPGGSLRQAIGKEQISLEQAVEWMKELTTALHYAHKRGVVHQDIKPDNIFITQDGNAKIGDFGLALIATGLAFERAASGKGTPAYMSPELCRGEPRDHRSDIYSLGAVFFEVLTGQKPFKATGMIEMALKHATAPVPSASDLRKDLPPILNKAVKYMMAKSPDSRLQSLGDLLPSLDKLLLEMKVARMGVGMRSEPKSAAASIGPGPSALAGEQAQTAATEFKASAGAATEAAKAAAAAERVAKQVEAAKAAAEAERAAERIEAAKAAAGAARAAERIEAAKATAAAERAAKQIEAAKAAAEAAAAEATKPAPSVADSLFEQTPLKTPARAADPPAKSTPANAASAGSAAFAGQSFSAASSGRDVAHPAQAEPGVITPQTAGSAADAVPSSSSAARGGAAQLDFRPETSAKAATAADARPTVTRELVAEKERKLDLLWSFKTRGPIGWAAGVVLNRAKKCAYVGSADGALYCLDMQSGGLNWHFKTEGMIVASCLVAADRVFVPATDGNLYCLNAQNGSLIWTAAAGSAIVASPALAEEQVLVSTLEGCVKAFAVEGGASTWTYATEGELCSSPQVVDSTVFIAGKDKQLHALKVDQGRRIWQSETDGVVRSDCLASSDSVYCATAEGQIYCFDIVSGNRAWVYRSDVSFLSKGSLEFSSVNYCGLDGTIVCLDKYKGASSWTAGAAGQVVAGIVSVTGSLYVASRNGYLQCFNARTGEQKWHAHFDAQFEGPPLATTQAIYLGTVSGELLAVKPPSAK